MKPLIVLAAGFLIALLCSGLFTGNWQPVFSGNLAMSAMLLFTATGHFAFPKGMAMMIPAPVPAKKAIVYITGVIEIAAAVGLMIPALRYSTAVLLIIFFIFILPANIYAALRHIDYQKGTTEGNGPSYLWFRIPLQLLFIVWVWYFSIYSS